MTTDSLSEFVISLERRLWNAVIEKNGTALGELLAGDYIEITIDGRRGEKSENVELSPQVDEIDGYVVDSETVVPLGENTAARSYHLILDGRCRGISAKRRQRLSVLKPARSSTLDVSIPLSQRPRTTRWPDHDYLDTVIICKFVKWGEDVHSSLGQ